MKKITGIISLICFMNICTAQSDSIFLHSIVRFYKYNDATIKNTDAINFILEVHNNSSAPVPDLGCENRSKHVNFFINGEKDNPLSLYNGIESIYGKKTIKPGAKDSFDSGGWILTEDAGIIEKYGNEFTVQWEYMNIKSEIIKVNLLKKTSIMLNKK